MVDAGVVSQPRNCAMPLVAAYESDSDEEIAPSDAVNAHHDAPPSGLSLPPPKRPAPQAKRQIVVESAPSSRSSDEKPLPKRARHDKNASSTGTHSLLNMLPAPQNKASKRTPKPARDESDEDVLLEDDARMTLYDVPNEKPAKGNEDFRAMLGLAPKAPTKDQRQAPVIVSETHHGQHETVQQESQTEPELTAAPSFSAAPVIEDRIKSEPEPSMDAYPGWKRDPDGSWYPVTPEAHAIYAAWAQYAQKEAELQVPHHAQVATVDASAELDRIPKAPSQAPAPETRPESLVSEKLRTDKFTNMRARTRGQLTSLLAMAHENRPMLEERWSQGKSKMRENKKRYGF